MADENENTEIEGTPEAQEPVAEVEETPAEEVEEPVSDEPEPAEDAEPLVAEAEADAPADEADEAEAASDAEAAEEPKAPAEVAAAVSEPKKKRRRLPRSARPQKTRRTRTPSTERKPITRLPKPEHVRGRRQERQGTVVSAAADKTIVVRVDVVKLHPRYKKVVKRSTKLHAHDEQNEAKVGDVVRIVETRPLSRMKRWRLQEIVEAAK